MRRIILDSVVGSAVVAGCLIFVLLLTVALADKQVVLSFRGSPTNTSGEVETVLRAFEIWGASGTNVLGGELLLTIPSSTPTGSAEVVTFIVEDAIQFIGIQPVNALGQRNPPTPIQLPVAEVLYAPPMKMRAVQL